MKQKSFIKGTAIGFVLSTTILFGMTVFADKYDFIDKKIEVIEKTLDKYYVGELDKTAMEEGIYKGLVSSVGDPYTTYYTKEEFDSIMEKTSGVYAGIGVQMMVDQTDNTILVTDVFEGSPAEKAGMLSKDKMYVVEIVDIGQGGVGIGKFEGFTVFVDGGLI